MIKFIFSLLLFIIFSSNSTLSQELIKIVPQKINALPNTSEYDKIVVEDVCFILVHKLETKEWMLIEADESNYNSVRHEIWSWYKNEAARLYRIIKTPANREHFREWSIEYFQDFLKRDRKKDRQRHLESKGKPGTQNGTIFIHADYFNDFEENIQKVRASVAEFIKDSPETTIWREQNKAEVKIHKDIIQTIAHHSLEDALNYLNWERVRESMNAAERRELINSLVNKLNAPMEQQSRALAYKSGGDIAAKQFMQDYQNLKDEIDSLKNEINKLKKQLGEQPTSHNSIYIEPDNSAEARIYRQDKRIDKLINQLNIERGFLNIN